MCKNKGVTFVKVSDDLIISGGDFIKLEIVDSSSSAKGTQSLVLAYKDGDTNKEVVLAESTDCTYLKLMSDVYKKFFTSDKKGVLRSCGENWLKLDELVKNLSENYNDTIFNFYKAKEMSEDEKSEFSSKILENFSNIILATMDNLNLMD